MTPLSSRLSRWLSLVSSCSESFGSVFSATHTVTEKVDKKLCFRGNGWTQKEDTTICAEACFSLLEGTKPCFWGGGDRVHINTVVRRLTHACRASPSLCGPTSKSAQGGRDCTRFYTVLGRAMPNYSSEGMVA